MPFSSGDADLVGGTTPVFKTAATHGGFRRKNVGNVKLKKGANKLKFDAPLAQLGEFTFSR